MKVLFVYERKIDPTFGGVERVTMLLAEEFLSRGHSVSFLSVGPKDWNSKNVETSIRQHHIAFDSPDFKGGLRALVSQEAPDVMVLQGTPVPVMAALNELPDDKVKVLVLHNRPHSNHGFEKKILSLSPWNNLSKKRRALKILSKVCLPLYRRLNDRRNINRFLYIASRVDKFILLSSRYVDRMAQLTPGIESDKLVAINNPNTFAVPESIDIEDKEKIILFVGRLSHPQKNVTGFIDVWKEFSKKNPDWRGMIVGDGEHSQIIKRYALRRGVTNLSFEGNRKNVEDYYWKSPILCMTSLFEGWPMVLAEAMAYGCVPVVYDSFEAVHDIIDNGTSGIIVKPFDAKLMAEALSRLAEDENLRMKMAEAGRKKIKDFSIELIADQWENLFLELKHNKKC